MKILTSDFTLPYLLRDSDYPVGGWAVELDIWLRAFAAEGHDAAVMSWKGAADYVGTGAPYQVLDTFDPKVGVRILKYAYDYVPSMLRAAEAFGPDVIFQGCASIFTGISAFIARRLGVPFVYRCVNDTDVNGRYRPTMPGYASLAYEYGIRGASGVICQNGYQEAGYNAWRPKCPKTLLYNPIFAKDAAVSPREARTFVAWLGVFQSQKNMPLLVKVARETPHIAYRIGGMPSTEVDADTMRAVEELSRLPNVTMMGYIKRTELGNFLSGAVCLLSTSHFEGFSNTFLEAFVAGTPVVIPTRVDPDGLVQRKALGLVAKDDDGLIQAVDQSWRMPSQDYREMSDRVRAYVRANHDPATLAKHFAAFLQDVVAREAR